MSSEGSCSNMAIERVFRIGNDGVRYSTYVTFGKDSWSRRRGWRCNVEESAESDILVIVETAAKEI